MHRRRGLSILTALGLMTGLVTTAAPMAAAAGSGTRQIPAAGTTSIHASAPGRAGPSQPELRPGGRADDGAASAQRLRSRSANNPFPKKPLPVPNVRSSAVTGSNTQVAFSFEGLNHFDQRTANNGNQFSLEPPDQGLCVGNGYTIEVINSVLQVYRSATGAALTGVQDLNTFLGYPAAINRATFPKPNSIGPDVIDPVCYYDPDNHRFIVATTILLVDSAGNANGKNTIDLAVSNTANPTGWWTIYHVPAQNDGRNGTPNHHCTLDGTKPGPCFQDYPHIGADRYGVYITTNEYDLFTPAFNAAQIFAFSKKQLSNHPSSIGLTLVENLHVAGTPGFTVWPATSPAGQYSSERNGTEYFLSSIAGDGSETGNPTGTANKIGLWALSNTKSLEWGSPAPSLSSTLIASETYVFPPKADQKPGKTPLRTCVNNTTTPTPFGPGCWQIFFNPPAPAHNEVESKLDANDTRMQQTWYTNGVLWGALDTAVRVGGEMQAGIAWFAVRPKMIGSHVSGWVAQQGYLGLGENNLTYPAIAMGTNGKGVMAFTVVGENYFPSAGYVTMSASGWVSPIHIAAKGVGPSDGFTSYKAFVGSPPRTRWGDYGAAVTDGSSIWIASEYIAQSCSYTQYYPNPPALTNFGLCGGTRTSLANWSTRVAKLNP